MNNEVLERLKEEYGEDDDLIQLYEDWGNTPYLHEIYRILDEHSSDWVLERELGSWAAEFILGILQEHEEELEGMPSTSNRRPSELRYLKKRLRNDMQISRAAISLPG